MQKGNSIVQVINKAGSIPATGATAPIVEWLAHISDKDEIKVQFLVGVQKWKVKQSGYCHRLLSEWFSKMDGFRIFCFPQNVIM